MLFLLACAVPSDSKPVESAIEPITAWYNGTSQGQTPDGSYVEDPKNLLFIRIVDEDASTITEQVWTEGGRDTWTYYELVHTVDAVNDTFTAVFVTEEGTLDVLGGYDAGEDWAWTAWHSASTYRDGTYAGTSVQSTDTMDATGKVTTNKTIVDTSGTETWKILELLAPMLQADFEAAQSAITVQ